jgi:hypothetical protein
MSLAYSEGIGQKVFLTFEGNLFHAITHLTVAKYSHALDFPNDFAISEWKILYVNPFFVAVAVMWVFAVFADVLCGFFYGVLCK